MAEFKQETYWQTIRNKAPVFLLLAVAATLPFSIQVNSYLIGLFALSVILQNRWAERWRALKRRKWWLLLFSSLWLIHVVGTIYSTNVAGALLQVERNLSMLIFPLAIFSYSTFSRRTLNHLLGIFVLSCLLACLHCWSYNLLDIIQRDIPFRYFFKWHYSYENLTRAIGSPSNYFSFYVVFALFALWWLRQEWNYRFQTIASILVMLVFIGFLFHLSARMSLLALFVTAILHAIRLTISKKKWKPVLYLLLFIVASIGITLQFPLLNKRVKDLMPVNEKGKLSFKAVEYERLHRWGAVLPLFYQNPLIGVGSGDDLQLIMQQYEKHELTTAREHEYNAHNQFLQYAVANGLLGVSCFLGSLLIPLALSWQKKKWLYVYFILIFGLCSLTESTMRRNKGIVFYGLFSSVFTVAFLANRPSEKETTEILKL